MNPEAAESLLSTLTARVDRIGDEVVAIGATLARMELALNTLVSIARSNADRLLELTESVNALGDSQRHLKDEVGGVREGLRIVSARHCQ